MSFRPMSPLNTSRQCLPVSFSDVQRDGCRSQDVAGVVEGHIHAIGDRHGLPEADAGELRQALSASAWV